MEKILFTCLECSQISEKSSIVALLQLLWLRDTIALVVAIELLAKLWGGHPLLENSHVQVLELFQPFQA
jgi:hypothetical protein